MPLKHALRVSCLWLVLSGPLGAETTGQVPGPAAPLAALPATVTLPRADLVQAFRDAAGVFQATMAAEPSLAETVLALNLDPKAAFDLIRGLQSLPYGGRLRDPQAVLVAGGGNAHDKAAALAEILGRMGHDTRLVSAGGPTPPVALACAGGLDALDWQVTGLGPDVLSRSEIRARASYAALHPMLAPQPVDPSDPGPHVWLQLREGGAWVDLDPWDPANAWGDHPGGEGLALTDPPAPQAVQITLTVERLADGALSRSEVLTSRLDLPQAAGALVSLSFGPAVEGLGGAIGGVLATLEGGQAEMVANLTVNDRVEKSAGFAAPGAPPAEAGFLAEGGQSVTTGLWLTVTSLVPGAPDQSETRPILDLVPAAVRVAAEAGTPVDPASLTAPVQGERFPAALESLRQLTISNGGTSRRLLAARVFLQLYDMPAVLDRVASDVASPWDVVWSSYLEGQRIALAAESLIAARPDHNGACAAILRPRVLIWGVEPLGGDQMANWLDWVLDDPGVLGGDAQTQAEARLWHGSVAAGLEKEALFYLNDIDGAAWPLDIGPMLPRDPALMGPEGTQDQAQGYLTLADAGLPAPMWWRLNPATGRTDARFAGYGNAIGVFGILYGSYVSASAGGTFTISAAEQAALLAETEFGYDSLIEAALRQIEGAEGAERARPKRGSVNEYGNLLSGVSVPSSVSTGSGVSRTVVRVFRRPR